MTSQYPETEPGPALGLPAAMLFLCAAAGLIAVAVFWPDKKPPEPQWLGMEVESLTADVRAALGLHPDQRGVYVSDVVGVAADAGVREGDVIVAVGRRPITGLDSYRAAAQASRGQSTVRLGLVRRGAPLAVSVGSRPARPVAGTPVGMQYPASHGYVSGPNGGYYPQQAWVPAALPPGCATCPNAAACLPPGGATPAAFTRGCNTGACPIR